MDNVGLTISSLLAVLTFAWGIYTYQDRAEKQLAAQKADAQRTAETRRIEATLPYLNKQLQLYIEATKVTTTIATSTDSQEVEKATKRFHELYWGELALVERDAVAKAMVVFRNALDANENQRNQGNYEEQITLAPLALKLAHACRDELAESWRTDAWKR